MRGADDSRLGQPKAKQSDPWDTSLGRGVKSFLKVLFGLVAVVVAIKLYDNSLTRSKQEELEEKIWRESSGYSSRQLAANEHFNKCAQYRRTPSSVWSDQQRKYALVGEGCYSDDRDDPQYVDATYPWNDYRPWHVRE